MSFPNGIDFVGSDLFTSDSNGYIFRTDAGGVTTAWLSDPELVGDPSACNTKNGFSVGTNGIVHDATSIYVVNTDKGALLEIPLRGDGTAGALVVLKKDCTLAGADGLLIDSDGSFLVANNGRNLIQRVTRNGVVTTVLSGEPLDGPATLAFEGRGAARRLLVTNSALGSAGADGGKPRPSLVAFPLPAPP